MIKNCVNRDVNHSEVKETPPAYSAATHADVARLNEAGTGNLEFVGEPDANQSTKAQMGAPLQSPF